MMPEIEKAIEAAELNAIENLKRSEFAVECVKAIEEVTGKKFTEVQKLAAATVIAVKLTRFNL